MRFLHSADWHLDTPFPGRLPRPVARRRREELRQTFAAFVDLALAEEVDLVLIAGDLIEQDQASPATLRYLDEELSRLDGRPVFIAAGNHDPLSRSSLYLTHPWRSRGVHIFAGEGWEKVELSGVTVWGFSWTRPKITRPMFAELTAGPEPSIVLVHADLVSQGEPSPYLPFSLAELAAVGTSYCALGHLHQPRLLHGPDGSLLGAYPGSPEPLNWGEPGEHGVILGQLTEGRVEVSFRPLATRAYLTAEVVVEPELTTARLLERIRDSFSPQQCHRDLCRVRLIGRRDPDETVDRDHLAANLTDFYCLEIDDQTQPDYDLEALVQREASLLGDYARAVWAELERASGEEQAIWERALYLGLDALTGRGVGRP